MCVCVCESNQIKTKQNTKNKSDEQIYLVNLLTEPNIHTICLAKERVSENETVPDLIAPNKNEEKKRKKRKKKKNSSKRMLYK